MLKGTWEEGRQLPTAGKTTPGGSEAYSGGRTTTPNIWSPCRQYGRSLVGREDDNSQLTKAQSEAGASPNREDGRQLPISPFTQGRGDNATRKNGRKFPIGWGSFRIAKGTYAGERSRKVGVFRWPWAPAVDKHRSPGSLSEEIAIFFDYLNNPTVVIALTMRTVSLFPS
jgi:hypothetical protein